MYYYTEKDYFSLTNFVNVHKKSFLSDVSEEYILNKARHHKHDKLFRNILNDKSEISKLINKELKPKKEIKPEDLEKYETKFITNLYHEKEADVVYKLKNREVYFLIEHQTKVDKSMPVRIAEYSLAILKSRMFEKNNNEKNATIVPIVIYSGNPQWSAKLSLEETQENFEHYSGSVSIVRYNLVDIRSVNEAIERGTALARMSVIEKLNSTEEIIKTVRKFSEVINDKDERKVLAKEIKYLLSDKLSLEEIEKIEEILIKREGDEGMLHAQMVIRRDFEKARQEGRQEGKQEGRQEGILEGRKKSLIDVAQKMLNQKIDVSIISKVTGLKKEEFIK